MNYSALVNKFVHKFFVRRVFRAYEKKSKKVEKKHPELFKPTDCDLVRRHKMLWSPLWNRCGDRWLRLHVNLTGIKDPTFCPEDVFFGRIERILNDCDTLGKTIEDKNNLWRYVPKGVEPTVVFRYGRGSFCDGEGHWLSSKHIFETLNNMSCDIVVKPCNGSGGNGVMLFKKESGRYVGNDITLTPEWFEAQNISYVVQKKIEQDDFSASFNPSSVNTLRVMTMRCPWNGEIVVLRSMMRMGVTEAVVDNMMKGGLCVCIGDKGQFGKYAYDYDGKRFEKHPVSRLVFEGLIHPGYEKIVKMAKEIAGTVFDFNLLSFDFVQRKDGSVCLVEINATSQGITQLQYDFGGLFGSLSEDVVSWCVAHDNLDTFKHLRTFY